MKKFLSVFIPIMTAEVIVIIIGYFSNSDVRGWWSLALGVASVTTIVTTLLMVGIDKIITSPESLYRMWGIGIALIKLILGILFYFYKIDWYLVNTGTQSLNFFENILYSDITSYSLVLIFPTLFLLSKVIKLRL